MWRANGGRDTCPWTRRCRPLTSRRASSGWGCTSPPRPSSRTSPCKFSLHPLAVEDAIHAHQRPKLEQYDDSLFVVLKTAAYHEAPELVEIGQVMIFLGDGFVVTVRHGGGALAQRPARSADDAGGQQDEDSYAGGDPVRDEQRDPVVGNEAQQPSDGCVGHDKRDHGPDHGGADPHPAAEGLAQFQ